MVFPVVTARPCSDKMVSRHVRLFYSDNPRSGETERGAACRELMLQEMQFVRFIFSVIIWVVMIGVLWTYLPKKYNITVLYFKCIKYFKWPKELQSL